MTIPWFFLLAEILYKLIYFLIMSFLTLHASMKAGPVVPIKGYLYEKLPNMQTNINECANEYARTFSIFNFYG